MVACSRSFTSDDDESTVDSYRTDKAVAMAAASFSASSMAMTLLNKSAISSFPLPCCFVAFQMMFVVLIACTFCFRSMYVGSLADIVKWCNVTPFFSAMLLAALFATRDAPASLVLIVGSVSPMVTAVVELAMPSPPRLGISSILTLLLITFGAALFAEDRLHGATHLFHLANHSRRRALVIVIIGSASSCACHLLQRLLLGINQAPVDISKVAAAALMNFVGFFPVMAAAIYSGEIHQVVAVVDNMTDFDWMWVLLSCVTAVAVSFTSVWLQSLVTATSMLTLMNTNNFIVFLIQVHDNVGVRHFTNMQALGTIVAVFGSVLYVRVRCDEEESNLAEKEPLMHKRLKGRNSLV
eukprot:TRINITY_DN68680_c0_g1_i1.p1 TRINITY_DN68680_c0_g1~~TRINITY_DN68680_c0_g1_i1.p1  ORF type:complete len:401 (+),score=64.92 TRINITY_DN68680_c0_g1_i1:142-1203(+)